MLSASLPPSASPWETELKKAPSSSTTGGSAKTEPETDESIIPKNFVEKLFINGAAYNFKQNTAHPKYLHWKKTYDTALADLLALAKNTTGSNVVIDGGYRKL